MKFYALVLWRAQGRVPRLLQLMYLGNGEIVRYEPDEADLRATERKIEALWQAIERARARGTGGPGRGGCATGARTRPLCPAFGGTPPPLPAPDTVLRPSQRGAVRSAGPGTVATGSGLASADTHPAEHLGGVAQAVVIAG